jgi:hypothetical protein
MLVQTTYEPSQTFADFAKADTVHAGTNHVRAFANLVLTTARNAPVAMCTSNARVVVAAGGVVTRPIALAPVVLAGTVVVCTVCSALAVRPTRVFIAACRVVALCAAPSAVAAARTVILHN